MDFPTVPRVPMSPSLPYCRHTMPLVYCLLADKKRESYYDCLDHVKRRMVTLDIVFNPPKILCDFEVGLISALRSQFPNASTKGCYFHHTKAIWAKVQDLGLVTEYNTNREIRQQVHGLMSLAFLPVILIRPNFMLIETSETTQASPALQQLCTYYQETWLNGNYPLSLWNVSTETVRTSNSVEGWHNKLNRTIGKIHPNIFELLQHLKKEQRETEVTCNQARLGASPPRRRRKCRELEAKITNYKEQLRSGEINGCTFNRKISHIVHHF